MGLLPTRASGGRGTAIPSTEPAAGPAGCSRVPSLHGSETPKEPLRAPQGRLLQSPQNCGDPGSGRHVQVPQLALQPGSEALEGGFGTGRAHRLSHRQPSSKSSFCQEKREPRVCRGPGWRAGRGHTQAPRARMKCWFLTLCLTEHAGRQHSVSFCRVLEYNHRGLFQSVDRPLRPSPNKPGRISLRQSPGFLSR